MVRCTFTTPCFDLSQPCDSGSIICQHLFCGCYFSSGSTIYYRRVTQRGLIVKNLTLNASPMVQHLFSVRFYFRYAKHVFRTPSIHLIKEFACAPICAATKFLFISCAGPAANGRAHRDFGSVMYVHIQVYMWCLWEQGCVVCQGGGHALFGCWPLSGAASNNKYEVCNIWPLPITHICAFLCWV